MKGVLWRGAVFLIMLLGWYFGRNCGDRMRYGERRPLGENARKCGLIWWIEKTVIEIIQTLLCFWKWSLYQNWRILAIVRRGSCLLVCEPHMLWSVFFSANLWYIEKLPTITLNENIADTKWISQFFRKFNVVDILDNQNFRIETWHRRMLEMTQNGRIYTDPAILCWIE